MRASAWVIVLVAGALAGCATGDGGAPNPNLLSPKLVVQPRPDGNVSVFVHGAFREHLYDWVSLRVDNRTVSNRSWVLSLEESVPATGFFLEAEAQAGDVLYRARGRVDVDPVAERARVALLGDEAWEDPRTSGLPFEHIMDRPKVDA